MKVIRSCGFVWLLSLWISIVGSPAQASIPKKASVFIEEAKSVDFSNQLIYPGRVKSEVVSIVASEHEGQIVQINKKLGTPVRRGEVVLILQNTDPVYRFAPIKVRAPAAGYVTSLDLTKFAKVERGQKLFTITDPKSLLIEVEVPAADLNSAKLGLVGEFRANMDSEQKIPVRIEALSPVVDIKTGTATAELKPLGDMQTVLRQGQLGQFVLNVDQRKSFLLPESAIIYRDDRPFVRVLQAGKVAKQSVELGVRKGDQLEVKSGLSEGVQVVLRTSRFVTDGEEVDVEKAPEK